MLVFGERSHAADPLALIEEVRNRLADLALMPADITRHGAIAATLLVAGGVAQGLADEVQARAGCDDIDAAADAAMRWLVEIATTLLTSWRSGFAGRLGVVSPALFEGMTLPRTIDVREPEGFGFYAVYPEAYAAAAAPFRGEGGDASVIGLRTIGAVLSATVAAELRTGLPRTLRPVGHPYARSIAVSARLASALRERPDAIRLLVDEGPGASGSSFGAAADMLEAAGIAGDRIVFVPSHAGPPGAKVSERHGRLWRGVRRSVVTLDALAIAPDRPAHGLADWFADLLGPAIAPLQDVSGGIWRAHRGVAAPCIPMFERRKFLLRTATGTWLLKFAGLGQAGEDKFTMARALHATGFAAEPRGLRYGFIAERWHDDAAPIEAGDITLAWLARYLGWRARHFAAGHAGGASLVALCDMARHNAGERLGEAAAARLPLDPAQPVGRRVRVDGRLHRWEWLRLRGGAVLKTDGLDHHSGHDMVGCQDIGWDVAGAAVEFDLSPAQTEMLRGLVEVQSGEVVNPRLLATLLVCYSAFQLGLWSMSPDPNSPETAALIRRYERRLA